MGLFVEPTPKEISAETERTRMGRLYTTRKLRRDRAREALNTVDPAAGPVALAELKSVLQAILEGPIL